MKKSLSVFLVLALLLALTACGGAKAPESSETPAAGTPAPGGEELANPLHSTDAAGLLEATGLSFAVPEGAEAVSYAYLDNGDEAAMAEMRFTLDGVACACRAVPAGVPQGSLQDISGLSYEWNRQETGEVHYSQAEIHWIEGQQGWVGWYDYAPGILYCFSMESGASESELLRLAALSCPPLQCEADGETAAEALHITDKEPVNVDLDGDGEDEQVQILEWVVDEFDNCEYGFGITAGGTPQVVMREMYMSYNPQLWLADLDGDALPELLFTGDSGSDDYSTGVYRWRGGALETVPVEGSDYAWVEGSVEKIENGTITIGAYCYVLGTYGGTRDYRINAQGKLAPVEGSIWSIRGEYWLETARELPVELDGAAATLPAGSEISLTGFDGVGEVSFVTRDGKNGLLRVSRDEEFWGWLIDGVAETECFVTLPYAG